MRIDAKDNSPITTDIKIISLTSENEHDSGAVESSNNSSIEVPSTPNASRKNFLQSLSSVGMLSLNQEIPSASLYASPPINPNHVVGGVVGAIVGTTIGGFVYCTYKSFTKEGFDEIGDAGPMGKAILVGGAIGTTTGVTLSAIFTRI